MFKTRIFYRTMDKNKNVHDIRPEIDYKQEIIMFKLQRKVELLEVEVKQLKSRLNIIPSYKNLVPTLSIAKELPTYEKKKQNPGLSKLPPPLPEMQKSHLTPEFNDYLDICKSNINPSLVCKSKCVIIDLNGDIMESSGDYKAHAVGGDLNRGAGAALRIKRAYPFSKPPPKFTRKPGTVVEQTFPDVTILNVVCKFQSTHKFYQNPNKFLLNYIEGLEGLATYCKTNNVRDIDVTPMGCGIDQLDWTYIKTKMYEVFGELDIVISVYHNKAIRRQITLSEFLPSRLGAPYLSPDKPVLINSSFLAESPVLVDSSVLEDSPVMVESSTLVSSPILEDSSILKSSSVLEDSSVMVESPTLDLPVLMESAVLNSPVQPDSPSLLDAPIQPDFHALQISPERPFTPVRSDSPAKVYPSRASDSPSYPPDSPDWPSSPDIYTSNNQSEHNFL